MHIYALLIGLNRYHPESRVRPLSGCHNDVAAVKSFLLEYYRGQISDEQNIRVLLDEDATRQQVIAGFREHLSQAREGDAVLIYYAGHGAQNPTAEEFLPYSTAGKDEGWVLYDSRLAGAFDLADKEIAILLSEIAINCPNIVVISDSCYSGSLTRSEEDEQARFTAGLHGRRPLSSYLEGAYHRQHLESGKLIIPFTKHILMSACDKLEVAMETSGVGGYFTSALLKALRSCNAQVNYGELYLHTCATIRGITLRQHPKAEAFGGFDPYLVFLGNSVSVAQKRLYPVVYNPDYDTWRIEAGIGHGICSDTNVCIPVTLFDADRNGSAIGQAMINNIGLNDSNLEIIAPSPKAQTMYWGELKTFPLQPLFVHCKDAAINQIFKKYLSQLPESAIHLIENLNEADIEIRIEQGNCLIYKPNTTFIHGIIGSDSTIMPYLVKVLDQIAYWNRFATLQNRQSRLPSNLIPLELFIREGNNWVSKTGDLVPLKLKEDKLYFRFSAGNHSGQALYMCLLHLNAEYGISILFQDTLPIANGRDEILLIENYFHLPNGKQKEEDIAKLFVSTEPIEPLFFNKPRLQPDIVTPRQVQHIHRGIGGLSKPDWLTKTVHVHVSS
jgi:hypothetical protein